MICDRPLVSSATAGRFRLPGSLLVASAALLLVGCGSKAKQAPPPPPPPEVTVVEVMPRSVTLPFEYPGRIEGSREVEVRARVGGVLLRRSYEEGRPVKKGQTLFVIDPAPYQAEVQAAEASLAEEKAKLSKADRELGRIEPLVAAHAISQRENDAAISEVEQARATVLSAEARLTKARLDLSYTRVEAPISGISSRAAFSEGSLVGPGESSLLTRVSQVQPIWVRFSVSDEELRTLQQSIADRTVDAPPANRREIELVFADGTVYPEHGRVNFSDSLIDPQTGSIDLRAELPNADGTLVPGQFVRVRLLGLERPATILVPQRAVQQGQQGKLVFVVGADNKVEARPVEVGTWIGEDWVIEKGLSAGDKVVVDGVVRVQPGAPVTIAPSAPAAGNGAGSGGSGR